MPLNFKKKKIRSRCSEDSNDETKADSQLLDKCYKVAQIFALIGIPIVVAFSGWIAQRSISQASTSKDYVQIAVQILREPRRSDDFEIRKWAIDLITANSPVTFSSKAGDQLSASSLGMLQSHPLLKPAMEKRSACPLVELKGLTGGQREQIGLLQQLCAKNYQDLFWLQIYLKMLTEPTIKNGQQK
jgi:hypothetical protein